MSQDITHHDQLIPDIAPYFSGILLWVTGFRFLHLLLLIKNEVLYISLTAAKFLCLKLPQINRFNIFEKIKVP